MGAAGGRPCWPDQQSPWAAISALICSSQWVPACSMAESFASRADRAGLNPARWILPGWFRAAARASSADVPFPVRCRGLGFAHHVSLTPFAVLCQVTGGFGGAAMSGAGAVPGQALSPGLSPHGRAAARALHSPVSYSWANTSSTNKLCTKYLWNQFSESHRVSPFFFFPYTSTHLPSYLLLPAALWWVIYSPPPWTASLLRLTVFLKSTELFSCPSLQSWLLPAAPKERERTGIKWLIFTFSFFFFSFFRCGAERGHAVKAVGWETAPVSIVSPGEL